MVSARIQRSPYWSLFTAFGCWKLLLASIALVAPSPAYDTSTALALLHSSHNAPHLQAGGSTGARRVWEALCHSLTRWDAIYFAKAAERGYVNEQEWAFGWGYTQAVVATGKVLAVIPGYKQLGHPVAEITSAILLSNACHLGSVLVLYKLTLMCSNGHSSLHRRKVMAWIASVLHILSPAGLFLSAPYSESLFSFLTFTGTLIFWCSLEAVKAGKHLRANLLTLLSAIAFSASCTVRTNGLLNGVLFLVEFVWALASIPKDFAISRFVRVACLGISGLLVAAGLALPQYIAYTDFCTSNETQRPWCVKLVPSIYVFVQGFYWNVGPFEYWTLSNLPLFLLAAPMLLVLLKSGVWGLRLSIAGGNRDERPLEKDGWLGPNTTETTTIDSRLLSQLATTQILLAGMAIVGYHVQIITRLSSGCIVWYWWTAAKILDEGASSNGDGGDGGGGGGSWILKWMVMYGLIQGVLFAGFLPPA